MSTQSDSLTPSSQSTTSIPLFLFVALCVSLLVVFKAPGFWTILTLESWRFVYSLVLNAHFQAFSFLRYNGELCRNAAAQILTEREWLLIQMEPRPLSFVARIRIALTVAACDVSVIIPALNEEKYLPRCLSSLVSQSRRERVEIIVVDGGSTNRTVRVAKEYADKVLVQRARPVGAGRNAGAREAEGEILAFIDADTIASFRWLEEITSTFRYDSLVVGKLGILQCGRFLKLQCEFPRGKCLSPFLGMPSKVVARGYLAFLRLLVLAIQKPKSFDEQDIVLISKEDAPKVRET